MDAPSIRLLKSARAVSVRIVSWSTVVALRALHSLSARRARPGARIFSNMLLSTGSVNRIIVPARNTFSIPANMAAPALCSSEAPLIGASKDSVAGMGGSCR